MSHQGTTLAIHRGAINKDAITTRSPKEVLLSVREALRGLGIQWEEKSEYKYKCVRVKRGSTEVEDAVDNSEDDDDDDDGGSEDSSQGTPTQATIPLPGLSPPQPTAYGEGPSQDRGDEIRFSIELTRIDRLADTYHLDIKRLKGGVMGYKYLYDTLLRE